MRPHDCAVLTSSPQLHNKCTTRSPLPELRLPVASVERKGMPSRCTCVRRRSSARHQQAWQRGSGVAAWQHGREVWQRGSGATAWQWRGSVASHHPPRVRAPCKYRVGLTQLSASQPCTTQRRVPGLKQHALLRVHCARLGRRDAKRSAIEEVSADHECAVAHCSIWIPASSRALTKCVAAIGGHAPRPMDAVAAVRQHRLYA